MPTKDKYMTTYYYHKVNDANTNIHPSLSFEKKSLSVIIDTLRTQYYIEAPLQFIKSALG
jgi:hypothetical protein